MKLKIEKVAVAGVEMVRVELADPAQKPRRQDFAVAQIDSFASLLQIAARSKVFYFSMDLRL